MRIITRNPTLLIPPRQVERHLPVLAQFQFSWPPPHVFPIQANVELGPQRNPYQLLERRGQRLSFFLRPVNFVANIRDESHSVVGDNLTRRRESHDNVPAGIVISGERPWYGMWASRGLASIPRAAKPPAVRPFFRKERRCILPGLHR